jgi:hypothetical protein
MHLFRDLGFSKELQPEQKLGHQVGGDGSQPNEIELRQSGGKAEGRLDGG